MTEPETTTAESTEAVATEPVAETTPAETPVATPAAEARDPLASRFAALSRREREVREQARVAKEAAKSLEEYERVRGLAKSDPTKLLEHFGLDYDAVTRHVLDQVEGAGGAEAARIKKLEARIAEIDAKREEITTRYERDQQSQVVAQHRAGLERLVAAGGEKFELVAARGGAALDEVQKLLPAYYEQTGRVLSDEEALELIEGELLKQERENLERLRGTKKLGTAFAAKAADERTDAPAGATRPTTLTNGQSAPVPARQAPAYASDEDEWTALKQKYRAGRTS